MYLTEIYLVVENNYACYLCTCHICTTKWTKWLSRTAKNRSDNISFLYNEVQCIFNNPFHKRYIESQHQSQKLYCNCCHSTSTKVNNLQARITCLNLLGGRTMADAESLQ